MHCRKRERCEEMNTMNHKGCLAQVDYDDEDAIFAGRLVGICDGVGFHADNVEALRQAFHEALEGIPGGLSQDGQDSAEALFGWFVVSSEPRRSPEGRAGGETVREEPGPMGGRSSRSRRSVGLSTIPPLRSRAGKSDQRRGWHGPAARR